MDSDDGYTGPATVDVADETVEVSARLAGNFDPISGKYHWYGRVSAERDLTLFAGKRATLHTPHGAAATTLSDLDPWGRARVEGFGAAPFEVLHHLP
jgi:Domain of unknown function (DUF4873)